MYCDLRIPTPEIAEIVYMAALQNELYLIGRADGDWVRFVFRNGGTISRFCQTCCDAAVDLNVEISYW